MKNIRTILYTKTKKIWFLIPMFIVVFSLILKAQEFMPNQEVTIENQVNKIRYEGDYLYQYYKEGAQLDYKSKLESGSIEESLISLYLFQDNEKFRYKHSKDKSYYFLGLNSKESSNLRDKLQFRVLYKFYYKVKKADHCLVRFLITNEDGDELMYHSRLCLAEGIWKVAKKFGMDPNFISPLMLNLRSEILNEILVTKNSKNEIVSKILKESTDQERKTISFEKLNKNYRIYQDKLNSYNYKQKKHFGIAWIRKYKV